MTNLITRHREIAEQLSEPGFKAHDWCIFAIFLVTVLVVAATSGVPA